ncbi:putative transcription factor C2H2 family [Helianthus anomalus]
MDAPVTTPCAHNFCISCLPYQSSNSEARVLRSQNNSMKCPLLSHPNRWRKHRDETNKLLKTT